VTLPAGSSLIHVTSEAYAKSIQESGFRLSQNGESGPGVYTTPDPKFAAKIQRARGSYTDVATFHLQTNRPLRLLDRSTPEGEKHFRDLTMGTASDQRHLALKKAGYDGVSYPSSGTDHEIVVHDPSAFTIKEVKHTPRSG